ncbi:AAA family ATPase [Lactobacillus sp. ESL0791]|uniref:AAA family ATPase n=1 Tax=Lactobacillus sp. ESL0791 TaxID=2983234 RepID=UPI0023F61704|nr:AAA family ATPase [Lactobacillus sp. ESL0791]MDF7638192.1 AAA family ATPase [Lactobacillus sp. ESL0791]
MKLKLKNIAGSGTSEIELNGITIVAGENNVGKSTIGKSLYSVFEGLNNYKENLEMQKKAALNTFFNKLFSKQDSNGAGSRNIFVNINSFVEKFCDQVENDQNKRVLFDQKNNLTATKSFVNNFFEMFFTGIENIPEYAKVDISNEDCASLLAIINVSETDGIKQILSDILRSEFHDQINDISENNHGKAIISLEVDDQTLEIQITNNRVTNINNLFNLNHSIEYIDDPFALDNVSLGYLRPKRDKNRHENKLIRSLAKNNEKNVIEQVAVDQRLKPIFKQINLVADGELQINTAPFNRSCQYVKAGQATSLNIGNTSAGLKPFIILKTLLENGSLENDGVIILDEPEIHLHPEWQIKLAEVIVLIQKTFNMKILLTTHSPYFIEAIEVFSAKYHVSTKYYLADMDKDTDERTVEDVSDNIEKIYAKLAQPLQELENLRSKYEN